MPHHFKGVGLHFKGVGIHFNGIPRHFKGVGLRFKGVAIHFKGHTLRFVLFAAPYTRAYWPVVSSGVLDSPGFMKTSSARLTCGNHRVPVTWVGFRTFTPSSPARAFRSRALLALKW